MSRTAAAQHRGRAARLGTVGATVVAASFLMAGGAGAAPAGVTLAEAGLPPTTAPAIAAPAATSPKERGGDAAAGRGFLTIAWGRALWAHGCNPGTPAPGVRTLEQTAIDLRSAGLRGVGGVVIDRTRSTRVCERGVTTATWADFDRLKSVYDWDFVSQSKSYARLATLTTDAQRYAQTGGTLAPLASHGHTDAWGAFLYPDDSQDLPAQRMVAKHFAFGRLYSLTPAMNTRAKVTRFPHAMVTFQVLGGRCYNKALPCHDITVRNNRLTTPLWQVVKGLNPKAGQWSVLQMFRLVEGKSGTMGQANAWDCTSPDWRNRWTGIPENYCRNTLMTALSRRNHAVLDVTPADMARRWGRMPG